LKTPAPCPPQRREAATAADRCGAIDGLITLSIRFFVSFEQK
jgi:hypothetical protein